MWVQHTACLAGAKLSETALFITYCDVANTVVQATVATAMGGVKWLGLAASAGVAGAPINVITQGVSSGNSGLTAGAYYFATSDGKLTTQYTTTRVGQAASFTDLLINFQTYVS